MGYVSDYQAGQYLSGCGSSCGCRSCSERFGEWYIPEEPEEKSAPGDSGNSSQQTQSQSDTPEQVPPVEPMPSPSPLGPPTRGRARGRQRLYIRPSQSTAIARAQLGELGWDTQYLPVARTEGHEVLTREAFGPRDARGNCRIQFAVGGALTSRELTPNEQGLIIRGNADTDIQYLRMLGLQHGAPPHVLFTLLPAEQKHHALRSWYLQPQRAARDEIVNDLRAQHQRTIGDPQPGSQLLKIGKALHLIQDSFSPAHGLRRPQAGWCLAYIRNYGPSHFHPIVQVRGMFGPNEHVVPVDSRDSIDAGGQRRAEAREATQASRQYLQIVFKAIYARARRDPIAAREAAAEFETFIARVFRLC